MDAEITEAFAKVFDRLNTACEGVVRIDQLLKDKLHDEPCSNLTAHLQGHKAVTTDWRRALIGGFVKLVVIAIVAVVSSIITAKIKGGP